jgi:hypothetical protein
MSYHELADLVTFRPLSRPLPGPTYHGAYSSPFSAPLRNTVALLAREVKHLKPRQTILEADFREDQLRQDGLPRASAKAASPGLILTLIGTPYGDLRYPCHTFHSWEDNLRGIALALEALRKVDRYGVTKRGEQYVGWKQLMPGADQGSAARGRDLFVKHGGIKAALKATHPDHGGNPVDFQSVQLYREQEGL